MKKKIVYLISSIMTFTLLICLITTSCQKSNDDSNITTGTVSDIDGNEYKTIKIGSQWWMAENLKVSKFRNGDSIPDVTDSSFWNSNNNAAYCWYNNDISNKKLFGALYNWNVVKDHRNVAPEGWHIPTTSEWNVLINFLGGDSIAGLSLKSTNGWFNNGNGNNNSGFNSFSSGFRDYAGIFLNVGASFWTTTTLESGRNYCRILYPQGNDIILGIAYDKEGLSIRCIKDN
jgi:uncharacterized protein (TIGR02145 family)